MILTARDKLRFWSMVSKSARCWEWTASTQKGYGAFGLNKRIERAHRVSYLLKHGHLPKGFHVLHKCDNPRCVRPSHLFLGTPLDNARDKERKGRHIPARGEQVAASKLTRRDVKQIRKLAFLFSRREIARMFKMSHTAVNDVVNDRYWRHV